MDHIATEQRSADQGAQTEGACIQAASPRVLHFLPLSFVSTDGQAMERLKQVLEQHGFQHVQPCVEEAQCVELRPVPDGRAVKVTLPVNRSEPYQITEGAETRLLSAEELAALREHGVCTEFDGRGNPDGFFLIELDMLVGSYGFAIAQDGLQRRLTDHPTPVLTIVMPEK